MGLDLLTQLGRFKHFSLRAVTKNPPDNFAETVDGDVEIEGLVVVPDQILGLMPPDLGTVAANRKNPEKPFFSRVKRTSPLQPNTPKNTPKHPLRVSLTPASCVAKIPARTGGGRGFGFVSWCENRCGMDLEELAKSRSNH